MSRPRGPGPQRHGTVERRLIAGEELRQHRWRLCPEGVGQNCWVPWRRGLFAEHPGGTDVLRDAAGHDVTETFDAVHSESAKAWADAYVIGALATPWDGGRQLGSAQLLVAGRRSQGSWA
eukprot:Skav226088  [mRNA]  locus=scaffold211:1093021:1094683:- [translate_table: standard]